MGKKDIEHGDSDSESDLSNDSDASSSIAEAEELKDVAGSTAIETLLLLVSIITVALSVTAMVMAGDVSFFIYIGGMFSLMAPYSWQLQRSLTEVVALQETHEAMKREVDYLANENRLLKEQSADLGATVERLNDVEGALDVITQKQGQGVAAFAQQVADGKKLLSKMKTNLKGNVLQSLLSIVMSSDEDGDFNIDPEETDAMIERLHQINGVTLREDLFRKALIKSGGSLDAVLDMVRDIVKAENVPPEKQIFLIGE